MSKTNHYMMCVESISVCVSVSHSDTYLNHSKQLNLT